jgi:DNA-binding NarL/FixJ family response regulator
MNPSYLNGREVLPPDVLAEVQKHASGLIWIPSPKTFYHERRQLILTLREQGVPTKEIARLAGISVRRVNQVVAGKNGRKSRQFREESGK